MLFSFLFLFVLEFASTFSVLFFCDIFLFFVCIFFFYSAFFFSFFFSFLQYLKSAHSLQHVYNIPKNAVAGYCDHCSATLPFCTEHLCERKKDY
ncbi:hypothetical protein STCU_12204 [Strigomonas culicis]|uniref:Uncharacterized protein n=1 Tax=Strigomonas culicis TaxID=28005 RepID=S9UKQ7_9TRYP|nr:hypothetical protein STCU_12204 [Strigomonas culicis]|eukprot:EPY15246.1 hypothetical protein STCU_12204 [Strigomonas culicis]